MRSMHGGAMIMPHLTKVQKVVGSCSIYMAGQC